MEAPAPVAIPGRTQPATANEQPAPVPESTEARRKCIRVARAAKLSSR